MISLSPLPYEFTALEPAIDHTTVELHYTKHHQWYVNKVNELITNTPFQDLSLEEIVLRSEWVLFNNAAQTWNHTFYREWLHAFQENNIPTWPLYDAIVATRGTFAWFVDAMTTQALNNFWSWWTWLVKDPSGSLSLINTSNAWCPLTTQHTPLLTIDVWEHAYYLSYQNRRIDYLTAIWHCINRDIVSQRFL